LAAVGLVSLSPALLAQNAPQLVPIQTALSATTISGYVDTSAVWNPGTGNANPAPYAFNAGKQDGFNLDAVDIRIQKALDESQWSAGYVAEISYGPDAIAIDGGAYPIRQAYVELRTPIGNGIDWQLGRWDSLLGYESSDSMKNPNYTHTYGKTFEPTENTGLLGAYKFCDAVSLQLGVADTVATSPFSVNARTDGGTSSAIESKKAVLSLVTLTAPDSWGALKGSTLAFGADYGQGYTSTGYAGGGLPVAVPAHDRTELYVGTTINTPVKDLTFGASWDAIQHNDVVGSIDGVTAAVDSGYFIAYAGYVSYKATDKLTINGRVEYAQGLGLAVLTSAVDSTPTPGFDKVLDATGTVQYDLWENVISRIEVRWDHAADETTPFGPSNTDLGGGTKKNEITVAANVIYKF